MIDYARTADALAWFNARVSGAISEGVTISLLAGGDFRAVVVYDSWVEGNSINMHVAAVPGRRWLTREFLRAAFRYPFVQLGLRRVTLPIDRSNTDARRFAAKLGASLEGIAREAGTNGDDLCIYGMLKRECRWLEEKTDGQEDARTAARS